MRPIDGLHHISLVTGDAPGNVDFYARVLGLRLVKKTVNQDDPSVYHLFYADEHGSPGADITFFEYPGARRGVAGAGTIASIVHRVASIQALDFWERRLRDEGVAVSRGDRHVQFEDPEGMRHELAVVDTPDAPLSARSTQIPDAFALQGFEAVRALVGDAGPSEVLVCDALGFTAVGEHEWEARGERRGGRISFAGAGERGRPGSGTVHHVAWAVARADMDTWRERILAAGGHPTPIIDRFYFESVYFREPGGILYELASFDGAGFSADEPADAMGQTLALPPALETLRREIEPALTPLPDTSRWRPTG